MYNALLNWVGHDENRIEDFSSLFLILDLFKLSDEFVEDEVVEEPMVKESDTCINVVKARLTKISNEMQINSKAPKILCVGGERSQSVFEIYNFSGFPLITSYPDLPCAVSHHCSVLLGGAIHCMGGNVGFNSVFKENKVFRLNTKNRSLQWELESSMNVSRRDFGAAAIDEYIIVAGGRGSDSIKLSSVEMFEVRLKKWIRIASLSCCKSCLAVVSVGREIFAIGGEDENGCALSNVECMSELDGEWKSTKSMKTARSSFSAVSCNGLLYAIGGFNEKCGAVETVEVFDPTKRKWSYVKSMNKRRRFHAACVLQGKIFVVGGLDNQQGSINAIECYDPLIDQWSIAGKVESELLGHTIIALQDHF